MKIGLHVEMMNIYLDDGISEKGAYPKMKIFTRNINDNAIP